MRFGAPRPGWLPTIVAIIGIAITLSAANWQYRRAIYKAGLQQDYSARQNAPTVALNAATGLDATKIQFRRVTASGHFLADHTILLDNRTRNGAAGYEVVTPLRLSEGSGLVLVNRGWIRGNKDRRELPSIETPLSELKITGTAVVPSLKILELSESTIEGAVWQNLVLSRYRAVYRLDVMDFVIQQEDRVSDGLTRVWTAPGFGVRTHQSYAVQWLIFSLLILFFYVYYGYIRRKPGNQAPE